MGDETGNRGAFAVQRRYCEQMDAPITARVCAALGACLTRETACGRRVLDWPGDPMADAVPLRFVGGLHALVQGGAGGALADVFAAVVTDAAEVAGIVGAAVRAHDAALLPWLDGPPQTNEPARSAVLMTGLMAVARRFGHPLEVLEIGSSAGLNLLVDRYRYDLGGLMLGPADAPVTIRPEWRGSAPAPADVRFASVRGVDVAPIDLRDPAAAARLRGYVWADNPERLERLTCAIAMAETAPARLEAGDAADWLEARLAEPQARGTTRVLMHSVVWQYLGAARQARIAAALAAAGGRADDERPLAWVRMEPDRDQARQELWVRTWPGGGDAKHADTQAHGSWIAPVR